MPSFSLRRLAVALAVAACGAGPAAGQGGFVTLDPSYGGETARRAFYGGFAVSGEAALRGTGAADPGANAAGALSLAARLDYAVLPQVDLALVADLTGAARSGPLGLSWVVVKPYWHRERTDYALRLAVDPASEGGLGFRQTDVAFLSTTALSPAVTNDFTVGARRVRTGFSYASADDVAALAGPALADAAPDPRRERLVGQELRVGWGYNVLFDPAGSRFTVGVVGEGGAYSVVRSRLRGPGAPGDGAGEDDARRVRRAAGWLRAGVEFSRPSYQAAPFVSVPVVSWDDVEDGADVRGLPAPRVQFGLRLTLR